jgi:hypothetical protein
MYGEECLHNKASIKNYTGKWRWPFLCPILAAAEQSVSILVVDGGERITNHNLFVLFHYPFKVAETFLHGLAPFSSWRTTRENQSLENQRLSM